VAAWGRRALWNSTPQGHRHVRRGPSYLYVRSSNYEPVWCVRGPPARLVTVPACSSRVPCQTIRSHLGIIVQLPIRHAAEANHK
jgi:hypothetical protein